MGRSNGVFCPPRAIGRNQKNRVSDRIFLVALNCKRCERSHESRSLDGRSTSFNGLCGGRLRCVDTGGTVRDTDSSCLVRRCGVGDLERAHRVQHRFQALHARAVSAFPPLHSLISTASRICVQTLLLLMLATASGLFVTHQ